MLHVHADGKQIIHRVQGLAGRELREGDLRIETGSNVVRQEYATAQITGGQLVEGGRIHHRIQAKRFADTT